MQVLKAVAMIMIMVTAIAFFWSFRRNPAMRCTGRERRRCRMSAAAAEGGRCRVTGGRCRKRAAAMPAAVTGSGRYRYRRPLPEAAVTGGRYRNSKRAAAMAAAVTY
jgi:hypothetical protein